MAYKSDIEYEHNHLRDAILVIEKSLEAIKVERAEKVELLIELTRKFTSAAPEFYNDIPITDALVQLYGKMIPRYAAACKKPYFGKIDFNSEGENHVLYIGKYGISDFFASGSETPIVIDWRAPVSELYYSTSYGETEYEVNSEYIEADVHLKTSFDIEDGKLIELYDSDIMANDELLIKYLSKSKDTMLTEIVATIQKDQNTIIRLSPYKNTIVQGVAGSGKTTVAIHRISYLLYNFSDTLNPENMYVIASGKLFLNYMTSMLPDLDVPDIKQCTLFEFLSDYIKEYDPKFKCSQTPQKIASDAGEVRAILDRVDSYFDAYEASFYESEGGAAFYRITLLSKEQVMDYISNNRRNGILDRAANLDSFIIENLNKSKEEIVTYILDNIGESEIKEFCVDVLKINTELVFEEDVRKRFSRLSAKYKDYYVNKLKKLQYRTVFSSIFPGINTKYSTRELAVMSLIVSKMRVCDMEKSIRHIVIDEAQDFDLLIYSCLTYVFKNANFTLVGDVMQSISDSGLQQWDDLLEHVFYDNTDFRTLTKSYRNTIQISKFAQDLVAEYSSIPLYAEPVIRYGREVCLYQPENIAQQIVLLLAQAQESNYKICAVICANDASKKYLYDVLHELCSINLLDQTLEALEHGNYILSLKDAKGLEFDVVILPDFDSYNLESSEIKHVYVAITRALHELHVFSENKLLCTFSR